MGKRFKWESSNNSSDFMDSTLIEGSHETGVYEPKDEDIIAVTWRLKKAGDDVLRLKSIVDGYEDEIVQRNIDMTSEVEKVSKLEIVVHAKQQRINILEEKIRKMEENGHEKKDRRKSDKINDLERKLMEMDAYCIERDNQNTILMKELQSLTNDNKDAIALCQKLESICYGFEQAWTNEKVKLRVIENELMETNSKVKFYEQELQEKKGCSLETLKGLKEEIPINPELRKKLKSEKDKEQMKIKIEKLNDNASTLDASQIVSLRKIESLQTKLREQLEEMNEKKMTIKELKDRIIREDKRSNEIFEENDKLKEKLLVRSQELDKVTKTCNNYFKVLSRLQNNDTKNRERENQLIKRLNEKQSLIIRLDDEKLQTTKEMTQKDQDISNLTLKVNKSLNNIKRIEEEGEKFKQYCKELERTESNMKGEIEQKANKLQEVFSILRDEVQTNYTLTEEKDELQRSIEKKDLEIKQMIECIEKLNPANQLENSTIKEFATTENKKDDKLTTAEEAKRVLKSDIYRLQQEQIKMMNKLERNAEIINEYKSKNDKLEKANRELEIRLKEFKDNMRKNQTPSDFEGNKKVQENEIKYLQKSHQGFPHETNKLEQNIVEDTHNTGNVLTKSKLEAHGQCSDDSRKKPEVNCTELNNDLDVMFKQLSLMKSDKERLLTINKNLEIQIENLELWSSDHKSKLIHKDQEMKKRQWSRNKVQTASEILRKKAIKVEDDHSVLKDKKCEGMTNEYKNSPGLYREKGVAMSETETTVQSEMMRDKKLKYDHQAVQRNKKSREKWIEDQESLHSKEKEQTDKFVTELNKAKDELQKLGKSVKRCLKENESWESMVTDEILQPKNTTDLSELIDTEVECKVGKLCKATADLKRRIAELIEIPSAK